MNKIILATLFMFSCSPIFAIQDSATEANRLYSERDYSAQGISKAKAAAEMYSRLATTAGKGLEQNEYKISEARALYFAGSASKTKEEKIAIFQLGINAAKAVSSDFIPELTDKNLESVAKTVLESRKPEEVAQLALALYYGGINLGSWAEANGVMESLNKWPVLRNQMLVVQLLNQKETALFGSNRVLGRAYYKLPKIGGGDMTKAGAYLGEAFEKTLNAKGVSLNGNNNIFWAEYLNEVDKVEEAKKVLRNFIDADLNDLDVEAIPENSNLKAVAKALLDRWED